MFFEHSHSENDDYLANDDSSAVNSSYLSPVIPPNETRDLSKNGKV